MAFNIVVCSDDPELKKDLVELLDTLEALLDEQDVDEQFLSLMHKKMHNVRSALQLDDNQLFDPFRV